MGTKELSEQNVDILRELSDLRADLERTKLLAIPASLRAVDAAIEDERSKLGEEYPEHPATRAASLRRIEALQGSVAPFIRALRDEGAAEHRRQREKREAEREDAARRAREAEERHARRFRIEGHEGQRDPLCFPKVNEAVHAAVKASKIVGPELVVFIDLVERRSIDGAPCREVSRPDLTRLPSIAAARRQHERGVFANETSSPSPLERRGRAEIELFVPAERVFGSVYSRWSVVALDVRRCVHAFSIEEAYEQRLRRVSTGDPSLDEGLMDDGKMLFVIDQAEREVWRPEIPRPAYLKD